MVPAISLDQYSDLPTLIILEENDWMELQTFKIAIFKCRKLNLTNFGKSLNGILTVNIRFCVFSLISQFVHVMTKTPCLWRKDPDQWNIALLLLVRKELHWQNYWRVFPNVCTACSVLNQNVIFHWGFSYSQLCCFISQCCVYFGFLPVGDQKPRWSW